MVISNRKNENFCKNSEFLSAEQNVNGNVEIVGNFHQIRGSRFGAIRFPIAHDRKTDAERFSKCRLADFFAFSQFQQKQGEIKTCIW